MIYVSAVASQLVLVGLVVLSTLALLLNGAVLFHKELDEANEQERLTSRIRTGSWLIASVVSWYYASTSTVFYLSPLLFALIGIALAECLLLSSRLSASFHQLDKLLEIDRGQDSARN